MAVPAVFVVLLMFATAVKTQEPAVFQNKKVILNCPENGKWFKGIKEEITTKQPSWDFPFQPGQYSCKYDKKTDNDKPVEVEYKFYVKGRVCENCFEMDAKFFVVIIVADLIGTAVVMMIIYKCSKKKSSDKPPPIAKPPPRTGNRPGHGPSEYESLNPNTRATDTYSTVVNNSGMLNRTG